MKPEISHRCPSCGASVREPDALFCRECGKPLSTKAKDSQPEEAGEVSANSSEEVAESEATKTAEQAVTESPVNESPAIMPVDQPESTPPDREASPTSSGTELVADADAVPEAKVADRPDADMGGTHPAVRRGDKTRERLHRASGVARGVTRGVMKEPVKQVEKIRHVSSVVIEEASYDPSLRFVLVALGLFVIFVVLLVLSKVMG